MCVDLHLVESIRFWLIFLNLFLLPFIATIERKKLKTENIYVSLRVHTHTAKYWITEYDLMREKTEKMAFRIKLYNP